MIQTSRIFRFSAAVLLAGVLLTVSLMPRQGQSAALSSRCRGAPGLVPGQTSEGVPIFGYKIVNAFPHDATAFTQGLVFADGVLYEGTGLRGHSTLRRVVLETGEVLKARALPDRFFGEGITLFGERLIQLTWLSGVGFIYAKTTFEPLQIFTYPTQGWGITQDGRHLIMSDGSAALHFLDPVSLQETKRVVVRDGCGPVSKLNELEYVRGRIYANIWQVDHIAIIAPETGRVTGWIALEGLLDTSDRNPSTGVLNGIAYDAENDRLFVTGKNWPKLFEIILVRAQ